MKSYALVCLMATVFADNGVDHSKMNMGDKPNPAKGKISKWTNYSITSKDKGDYWLDGKYGTHVDAEGKMNFDIVTVVHAKPDVGLKNNWVY